MRLSEIKSNGDNNTMANPCVSTTLISDVIRQLSKLPENVLTAECIAATFADRLSSSFDSFDRTQFIHDTGITPRMIEDAEAKAGGAVVAEISDVAELIHTLGKNTNTAAIG